jgi:hypothetical protein
MDGVQVRQVTLREAGKILGISDNAARKRYERGSLEGESGEDGRIYVWVDDVHPTYTPDSRLIERLESEVEYLREQLESEKEAHREARRIIGGLVQRMPEIEATSSVPEYSKEGGEMPSEGNTQTTPDVQETKKRSFWQKMFGG